MNLTELFEVQRKLDAEIERKHPTAPGEDRLAKRILALQVELGELANEWRGFKFWSTDQEPRTSVQVPNSHLDQLNLGITVGMKTKNPLLEEYVDCLHFILSIGLDLDLEDVYVHSTNHEDEDVNDVFSYIISEVYKINEHLNLDALWTEDKYITIFCRFLTLGEMLNFTEEMIVDAYMSKNKTNWERQANGY